jgi:peptidoglycan hydrolase CwlO-like protein
MAAPVKHTCPDIDKCIKLINSAIKDAESGMKITDRNSDEHDYFRYIISNIEDIEGILEDLRSSNDALRSWGEELTNEIESSANYIDELEQKIEKHENTLQHT